jgi:outer membrane protein assembly complex protein YaeT
MILAKPSLTFLFGLILVFNVRLWAEEFFQVKSAKFTGNESFSPAALLKNMETQPDHWYYRLPIFSRPEKISRATVEKDLQRLKRFYQSEGYFAATVTLTEFKILEKQRVAIQFAITENKPSQIDSVQFTVENGDSARWQELKIPFYAAPENYRYREVKINEFSADVRTRLLTRGYAFAEITHVATPKPENRIWLTFKILFGPVCRFDSVRLEGLERIPPPLVQPEITIQPGRLFDLREIRKTQINLYQQDLFRYVNVVPDLSVQKASIPVTIFLKERKQTTLRLGMGYGTEENLRLMFELKKRNFLGSARTLTATGKYSGLGLNAQSSVYQPHFLWRSLALALTGFYRFDDEISYNAYRSGSTLDFIQKFGENLTFNTNYRIERTELDALPELVAEELQFGQTRYVKSIIKGVLRYQKVDQILDPTRGSSRSLSVENSHRITGEAYQFWKAITDFRFYFSLPGQEVAALRVLAGVIETYGTRHGVPFEERFFAGGSNSVRGYRRHFLGPVDENNTPTGGNFLVESNLELRKAILDPISLAIFYELGNVWPEANQAELAGLRHSLGFGLRVKTPVGPIRLDFAFKLRAEVNQAPYQIHLSVGQAF